MSVFTAVLDWAISNAYVLYKIQMKSVDLIALKFTDFKRKVAVALVQANLMQRQSDAKRQVGRKVTVSKRLSRDDEAAEHPHELGLHGRGHIWSRPFVS